MEGALEKHKTFVEKYAKEIKHFGMLNSWERLFINFAFKCVSDLGSRSRALNEDFQILLSHSAPISSS